MINYEIRDSQVQFESLPHSIEMFIYDRIYFTNLMLWRLDAGFVDDNVFDSHFFHYG